MNLSERDKVVIVLGVIVLAGLYYVAANVNPCAIPNSPWYPGALACSWEGPPTGSGEIVIQTWSSGCPAIQSGSACGSPYPNFQVAIYNGLCTDCSNAGQMVQLVRTDSLGIAKVQLPPGSYVVYTKVVGPNTPGNYGGACTYPSTYSPAWVGCATSSQTITIVTGQTVSVTVNIPNGIQ